MRLDPSLGDDAVKEIQKEAERLAGDSPFGWGHTIDFGPFQIKGLLDEHYLRIAGLLDEWEWWPKSLAGLDVADVGCFTGGLSVIMAARGARRVLAVDEIPEHVAQSDLVARAFGIPSIETLETTLYQLPEKASKPRFDLILLSGVLYHLSDMMVGLLAMREMLKPGGILLMETNAVNCSDHSYANFGRFANGMWWQPTALCIKDICEFTGFREPEVRFFMETRCLVRVTRSDDDRPPFRRGINWPFSDIRDDLPRPTRGSVLAPAPCDHG